MAAAEGLSLRSRDSGSLSTVHNSELAVRTEEDTVCTSNTDDLGDAQTIV